MIVSLFRLIQLPFYLKWVIFERILREFFWMNADIFDGSITAQCAKIGQCSEGYTITFEAQRKWFFFFKEAKHVNASTFPVLTTGSSEFEYK